MNAPDVNSKLKAIRWGRVLFASLFAEAAYFLIIWIIAILLWFVPGWTETDIYEFTNWANPYIYGLTGVIIVFIISFLVGRTLNGNFVMNGIMVGVIFSMLSLGWALPNKMEARTIICFMLNMVSGCVGGLIAQISRKRKYGISDAGTDA